MAESLDQIGAAIPFLRLGRVRLILAFGEEQCAPAEISERLL